jgi:hypothetical protein
MWMPGTAPTRRWLLAILAAVLLTALSGLMLPTAEAAPPTPDRGPRIEPLAPYDPVRSCPSTADRYSKPGVVAFRDLLNATYGSHWSNILRSCTGGPSEHWAGRALDWSLNAGRASDRATADDIFRWLFATDRYGNRYAMARRLGVMYIIWNGRIWGSYRAGEGWRSYGGVNPHTDHIHFSFSRAGALKQTSYWTGTVIPQVGSVRGGARVEAG